MALSIGVSQGSKIRIGGSMLKVVEVLGPMVTVQVDNGPVVMIGDAERTQIMPDVYVQVGVKDPHPGSTASRLAFEAPRSIPINRVKNVAPA